MGLDIGGNQITQASSTLTINTGVSMSLLSAGGVRRPNHTQFTAPGAGVDWVYMNPDGWYKVPFTTATVNDDACYSTVNSRFTAPVVGWYFFEACIFLLIDGASDGYYFHPVFAINGNTSGGVVGTAHNYRLRGHGQPINAYLDSHITQVYNLSAGDYVEHYLYSAGGGTNRYYQPYSRFTGFLLG